MKTCVVSIACDWDTPRYSRNLGRLVRSLSDVREPSPVLGWTNTLPHGARTDHALPYRAYCAKPFAFIEAMNQGFDVAIWCDSSLYAVRPLADVFSHIGTHGYYVQDNGFMMGQWASDACLRNMGVDREESFTIPEISTCCIGLDLRRDECKSFVAEWAKFASDGETFIGEHANDIALRKLIENKMAYRTLGHVSDDPRVYGHRHDQTVGTWLSHQRGWVRTPRPKFVDYWAADKAIDTCTYLVNDGR
jgi:hypothetical protein